MNPYDKKDDIRLGDRIEQMNKDVRSLGRKQAKGLRQSAATHISFTLAKLQLSGQAEVQRYLRNQSRSRAKNDRKTLVQSIGSKVRSPNLYPERLSLTLTREGIFLARGVGRGRPVGSAAAKRNERNWLYPIMANTVEQLADLLEQHYADIAAGEVRILIPGIINSRINLGS